MPGGDGLTQQAASDRLASLARGISASADRLADGLRRWRYVVLLLFSILYLLATGFRASQKLFWFDEVFTVYVSRLPDMASVWSALKQGVDFNPPLFYLLTRSSEALFGEGHIATRLPEILGFWVFSLCLFRFVSARTTVLAGLISMLFPLVTTAYFYAYEARPHGIVLGFGGLALVCWQGSTRSKRRRWWLSGLFVALVCATLTHTYAILLLVPLALAEFVRTAFLRRIDWAVWLAIASSSFGMLLSLPLFRASKAGIPSGTFPARGSMLANTYQAHFGPAAAVLVAGVILYFLFTFVSPTPLAGRNEERRMELPELAAVLSFLALPFFSFLLARLTGAPYFHRYSISAVAGVACIFGMLAAKRTPVGLCVLFVLVLQIALNLFEYSRTDAVIEPSTALPLSTRSYTLGSLYQALEAIPNRNLPILLLDNLEFFPVMHYAPASLSSRLVYLMSAGFDTNGQGAIRLQRLCGAPGRFESLQELLAYHDTFLALCNTRSLNRVDELIRQGANVKIERLPWHNILLSVTFQRSQGAPALPVH